MSSALRRLRIKSYAAPCVLAFAPPLFHSLPWRSLSQPANNLSPSLLYMLMCQCMQETHLFCFLGFFTHSFSFVHF
ncbi:hypothetical protein V8C34DRAFT_295646 [Trichoderma compactum]